jgi:hypothetical protein
LFSIKLIDNKNHRLFQQKDINNYNKKLRPLNGLCDNAQVNIATSYVHSTQNIYVFVTKKANVYNIEYIHTESFSHGGLDLSDSSMLTVNLARRSPLKLEKTTMNPFHRWRAEEAVVGRRRFPPAAGSYYSMG